VKKQAASSGKQAAGKSPTGDTIVRVLGVRHHGPGSARGVRQVLEAMRPDVVLIEGPPDADELIPLAAAPGLEPPVALLVYRPDQPKRCAFYPFAEFSPEWQAIQVGLDLGVPVRFIDLPQAHQLADPEPEGEPDVPGEEPPEPEAPGDEEPRAARIRRDPLQWLAEAAGYDDGERWWEHLVEHRRDEPGSSTASDATDVFAAISDAMAALRAEQEPDRRETLREAHMRQAIRSAIREGFGKIAVICGAWHAPVLEPTAMRPAREDAAWLKGLPKVKVAAAWVPWTHGRLCRASGYGAGIGSPGWYHHLWTVPDRVVGRWLTRAARLLRSQDLDASSAHVIEAARLAEAMAALHGRALPDLSELNDAVQAVLCFGDALPMRLIHEKLIVGEILGKVPADAKAVPLQQDLLGLQKRLKLAPTASCEVKTLDLRKPTDLERSQLLHRLRLLGIPWGELAEARGKGTFKEVWRLQWQPEFAVAVIEAAVWGNTVAEAAEARARDLADRATALPALTALLDQAILAELPGAVGHIMERVREEAALASDIAHLMEALPPLAGVLRYGNVRGTDTTMVAEVVGGLLARIAVGLPAACYSLNDQAAGEMHEHINHVDSAVQLIDDPEHRAAWHGALSRLIDQPGLHGLVAGRCVRLLLDAGALSAEDAARRFRFALSAGSTPGPAAAWVEGLLRGHGALLLHDDALWGVLDDWVDGLAPDTFPVVLPLLRRTFSTFTPSERRQMGQRVASGRARPLAGGLTDADLDVKRAESVLPRVAQLLGIAFGESG
jgi:hypothetical protein